MRRLPSHLVFLAIALSAALATQSSRAAESQGLQVVARHTAIFTQPPRSVPTRGMPDGPLIGNGDVGVVLAGPPEAQAFYFGKNDFWKQEAQARILAVGRLTLSIPALQGASYRQEQDMARGEVRGTFANEASTVHERSWLDADANLLLTELQCEGPAPLQATLRLAHGNDASVPASLADNGRALQVGREQFGGGRWYFHGEIADVRVSDAVLPGKVAGSPKKAESFDGNSTFRRLTAPKMAKSVSVAAWIKIESADEANYIVSKGEWNRAYSLGLSNGRLRWSINGTFIETEQPLELHKWIYVVGTYDGAQMCEYVDGALKASLGGSGSGRAWFTRKADKGPGGRMVAVATRVLGSEGMQLTLKPGEPVTVATAILSDLDARDCLSVARNMVADLTPARVAALAEKHRAWWADFWSRSFIEIPDKEIEKRWYAALYVMGSCSRPGKVAPGLWGNWITDDNANWCGDFHLNYNFQAPFYIVYGANHPELCSPLCTALEQFLPSARKMAKMRGWKGAHFPTAIGPWGISTAGDERRGWMDLGQRSDGAFAALNFIWYWQYSQDREWLKNDGYPFLREVADFWEDYLKFENGRYVIYNDSIHEGSGPDFNPLLSLGLVRTLFKNMLSMSEELDVDAGRRAKWRHILDHISEFPVQQREGKTVFRYSEKGTAWWNDNTLGIHHIFPAGAIGLDSDPRLLEISRNMIDAMHRWADYNGFSSWYTAAARVGYDPKVILAKLRAECDRHSMPNLLLYYGGGGIESCGGFLAINEMLLQSHDGVLRFFPCWPKDDDARFGNLRAVGAFLVSAELKAGVVTGAKIVSEKGRPCIIQNPWPGRDVRVVRNGKLAETATGNRFTFPTAVNETVELQPRDAAASSTSPVREIIVVCKTHFDLGYTHRAKDIVQYYRTGMIDHALDVMEKFKGLPAEEQFAWTAPGWVMAKVLEDWPGQTPQRRQRLEAAFKSGKFITHAAPFSLQCDFVEPEELARGFVFSSSISRRYGLPLPAAAKMSDVPSQTRAYATVLAHGGVRFMHIGGNSACSYPAYPPLFWWQGPDGSRVLAMYSASYGSCDALYPHDWLCSKNPEKDGCLGHNLLPPAGWPYKTWMALIVTPDNSGPPSAEDVKALFDDVAAKLPGVKVRMGRMEDFADAILAEHPDLPVVDGEAPDTWIHGIMCDPGGVRTARNVRPLLPVVEAMNTQLRAWGLDLADPSKDLARAYEASLLYSEHTWGGSTVIQAYGDAFHKLPAASYADLEASWEDKTDYIRTAAKIVRPLVDAQLGALANAVHCRGPRVLVYNPLPWKRGGVVVVKTTATALEDLSTGKRVHVQAGRFLAADVPACGYKTYRIASDAGPSSSSDPAPSDLLENKYFKIALDPEHGTIASLIDKRTGREWVDRSAAQGLGQYLNERFDFDQTLKYVRDYQNGRTDFGGQREWLHPNMYKPGMPPASQVPYRAASPRHGTIRFECGAVGKTAIMDMPADPSNHLPAATLAVTLYRAQPYVDLELTIRDKAKDNWPEADWLCLPLKIASPTFRVGRSLGTMDPAKDILPGANRHIYVATTGVSLTDADGSGIGLCSPDCPLISLDSPGCWTFSRDFVPSKPVVFFNLYNNQWNTNYRYWYPGTWSSRVRLWTFDRDGTTATALIIPSLETRLPLLAAAADGPGGTLATARTGLTLSRPGVLVSAFGTDPDGNPGTLLRLWEQSGTSGKVTVALPAGLKATNAVPVDLRGQKTGEAVTIANGEFDADLPAYAPASFLLQ